MSIIVVFKKIGKKNYQIPKAYRLIVLLNIINKALKLVITYKISYIIKIHNILPLIYLGSYKGISIKYIILYLVDQI